MKKNPDRPLHLFLWIMTSIVLLWSYVGCRDRLTWFMEVFPVLLGTAILYAYYGQFRFTRLVCWLLFIHAIVLMVGGHYNYAEVPLFNWLRDLYQLKRNYYDRVGHFLQGFVPALIAREVLLRQEVVKRGFWLNFIVISICLAFSAFYELIEWQAAVWNGQAAEAFLGTQGDTWDTQWDMALALTGSALSLAVMSRWHDRQLKALKS